MLPEPTISETAKQRSLRVPLDHYERPSVLARAKWKLAAVAALVAAAYFAWLLFGGTRAQRALSPGPLASVHAAWSDDCQQCHVNFRPLRSDAVDFVGLVGGGTHPRVALDEACIKCHNTPEHHAAARPDAVPNCAACHRDHRGAAANIVRASDASCLACHRELAEHREGNSRWMEPIKNVTGFAAPDVGSSQPHPHFRSLEAGDPGNIKFNHWLHLQPGVAAKGAKRHLKLADIGPPLAARYEAFKSKEGLIELDCAACHEPDSTGRAMQPIAYEQHCRACHPLDVQIGDLAKKVPHGLTAEPLGAVLGGFVLAARLGEANTASASTDESGKLPLIPGRTLGDNLAQKIQRDLGGQKSVLAQAVTAKCIQCHYVSDREPGTPETLPEMRPAEIPAIWFQHARFSHGAHRHIANDCRACHEAAFDDTPRFITPGAGGVTARDDQTVMIAGIESCAKCHAPARGQSGMARYDCAECHAYHGGDAHAKPGLAGHRDAAQDVQLTLTSVFRPSGPRELTNDRVEPRSYERGYYLTALRASDSSAPVAGVASCLSAGCHGSNEAIAPAWQGAFSNWAAGDPHALAYDVLWTHRGREMTRLLDGSQGQASQALTDAAHAQALERRCVGCHATPAHSESAGTQEYALGVHCESCHGAAGGWLHTHYREGFARGGGNGFIDTKSLDQRAGTCMKCHVGPNSEAGSTQVVDHDLIAAGHPRLAFEFHSYSESLPAHWDRAADESRHPGGFHFGSWLAGQRQQAEHHERLVNGKSLVDFAQLDCFTCHHQLAGEGWRQSSDRNVLQVLNWPATLPELTNGGKSSDGAVVVRGLIEDLTARPRWDAAVQTLLAARAMRGDLSGEAVEARNFDQALTRLGTFLGRDCFSTAMDEVKVTPYDSPSQFQPEALHGHLKAMQAALKPIESSAGSR